MFGENDVTKHQVDILTVLADEPRSGARVLAELEDQYETGIPHGRVYQNLDVLSEMGYVEKDENGVDDRTHRYAATDEGITAAREYVGILYHRVSRVDKSYRQDSL